MRELKVRIWDKVNKFMITEDTLSHYIHKIGERDQQESWGCAPVRLFDALDDMNDEFILMLSTGIKDKNGKEIFEGDILDNFYSRGFVYMNRGVCGPCKGDSVMSYILSMNIENPLYRAIYNIWDGNDVEVIGNIYENPSLLNGLK